MEKKIYKVKNISGEYATLTDENGDELFIALALLPIGVDIGTTIEYSFPDYKIIE